MAPWITRKSESTIRVSPFKPFLVITSLWLLVLTALAYDAAVLGPASSARFVPLAQHVLKQFDQAFSWV